MIPTNDTHVVCFTAVKDDMPKEDWDNVVAAPVKHMMRRLGDDLSDVTFIAPPWGRSFQKQAKQVAPDAATTIQFHARIREIRSPSRFESFWKWWGFSLVPKRKTRKSLEIIWWFGPS